MSRGPVIAGAAAALVAVAGIGWWAFGRQPAGDAAAAPVYATAERRPVVASVLATGILRLRVGAEVRVGAQLSGIVEKLNVVVGSKVRKGDVIAEIDSSGIKARLAQARAQVQVVEQEVRRAEVELRRARDMDAKRLVARSEVEDAELALDDARARLEKARRDTAVVETDLAYAVIRSPINGTVASVTTQEGETVASSFNAPTFATVIEDGALELIALVDETDIGGVSLGSPVTFTVEAYPAREFTARVERIAPKGTIISGVVNYEVMASIDAPDESLKPDMTANVSIRSAERQALVIPDRAVLKDDSSRYVYVEQDGQPVRRDVSIGGREGGYTEIRDGLAPGDRVLTNPPG
jgi:macrolide-specific efflux system membrane fusion protein